ncbi:hypothetical protein MJ579_20070 [Klebsiella pneumoniae]|nr:hypothetical protein MJ579_20070 [Klebsiella pneumoniae]
MMEWRAIKQAGRILIFGGTEDNVACSTNIDGGLSWKLLASVLSSME